MSIGSDGAAIACTGARYTAFHQRIHCLWNMSEAEYSCGMATHCVWWVILVIEGMAPPVVYLRATLDVPAD